MIEIKVNGKMKNVKEGLSIFDFLKQSNINIETVIIAYNKVVVQKDKLNGLFLQEGAELEILRITAGG